MKENKRSWFYKAQYKNTKRFNNRNRAFYFQFYLQIFETYTYIRIKYFFTNMHKGLYTRSAEVE